MNLTEWRTAVKEQAGRLRSRLSDLVRQTEQLAPGVIYGATAGLAVLPLVAAAQGGAVPYGELAGLLGGMGVNLLSNELYAWKQRSEKEIDQNLPAHLSDLAAANPDWRDLLNKLIQETQAATAARDTLGSAASAYLAALDQDLQRLGNRLIIANVSGAQNVIIGDNNVQNITTNNFYTVPEAPITFPDILRAYLAKERRLCDELPLVKPKADARRVPRMQRVFVELRTEKPVDEATWFDRLGIAQNRREKVRQQLKCQAGDGAEAKLRRAGTELATGEDRSWYAELHRLDDEKLAPVAKILGVTPAQIQAARHPLTPLEHLCTLRSQGQTPHMVLLGDPGGGKSTWVRRLTSVLAWQQLAAGGETLDPLTDEEVAWLRAAQRGLGEQLTPIRIAMHRWASLVRQDELKLTGAAADLVAVCAHTLQTACTAESISIPDHTRRLLQRGQAVILLDGLDEVSDDAQRERMIAAVRAFATETTYRNTPLLITCRSKPYARLQVKGQAVLADTHVCTLGPLDDDAIDLFIERWYAEMIWAKRGDPAKLQADARRLHDALPVRPDLQRMAGTPLLLTMMARTNQESGLPDGRAELYENLVQELLWEWEKRRTPDEAEGNAPGGGNAVTPSLPADAPRDDRSLLEILRAARPDLGAAHLEQVLNQLAYAVHGAGGDDAVEIARETLEKWMRQLAPHAADDGKAKAAATELATNVVNFIGQRTGLLVDIEDGDRFRFTHYTFQEYLAARWIATGGYGSRLHKMQEKVDDGRWREAVFLALGCMVSSVREAYDDALVVVARLLHKPPQHEQDWGRVQLVGEAFVRQFTPEKLALATDVSARSETLHLVADRLRQAMQARTLAPTTRLEAGLLLDDLRSQHGLAPEGLDEFIPVPGADFAIGKYPVTNGQFKRFVDAGGYGEKAGQRPAWWSEAGWKYRLDYDWTAPRYWNNRQFNRETQPMVGVSWYEAKAYCDWLNLTAAGQGYKPERMTVQLPTQEQWMLAARNGQPTPPDDTVDYPWASAFDATQANTNESNFSQTTPVDMYPAGATPAGVCDLAGNVWEFMADLDKDGNPYLKGGGWQNDAQLARTSAADYRSFWYGWNYGTGFRVVCVPVSHS